MRDGMETFPAPLADGRAYPGGKVVSYDKGTGRFATHDRIHTSEGPEGAVTFAMDPVRRLAYAISWPHGHFLAFDLAAGTSVDMGPVAEGGEAVHPRTGRYRCLCRSLLVDPRDGMVYFSGPDGRIHTYQHGEGLSVLETDSLRRDYFGQYDETKVSLPPSPSKPLHCGCRC